MLDGGAVTHWSFSVFCAHPTGTTQPLAKSEELFRQALSHDSAWHDFWHCYGGGNYRALALTYVEGRYRCDKRLIRVMASKSWRSTRTIGPPFEREVRHASVQYLFPLGAAAFYFPCGAIRSTSHPEANCCHGIFLPRFGKAALSLPKRSSYELLRKTCRATTEVMNVTAQCGGSFTLSCKLTRGEFRRMVDKCANLCR